MLLLLLKKESVFLLIFVSSVSFINAQDTQEKKKNYFIKFSGMVNLSYENYSVNTRNYENYRARYPDNLYRIYASASIRFGKYFSIPFGVSFSNSKTTYNLPSLPEEGIYNYVRNPRNNFHISPHYKWAKAIIGSHTPHYSSLSTGDIQIFGGGIEINPGKFIFSADYGISQYAHEPIDSLRIGGAYRQKLMSARIGYGKINGSKITLNFVKIQDDVTSVVHHPVGIDPKEGISISPVIELKIFKRITIKSEVAASAFTTNKLSDTSLVSQEIIDRTKNIMPVNNSTHFDYAHISSIKWKGKNIGLGLEYKYIGAGFVSVGYRNYEKDIIDYKLLTNFKLLKNKLVINATGGVRTNNISNTKLNRNNRLIANVNLTALISKKLTLTSSYSNLGFKNDYQDDLRRVDMINNSFSITPTYQFKTKKNFQQISLTASLDKLSQYDPYSRQFVDTDNQRYQANYILNFNAIPLTVTTFVTHLDTKSEQFSFNLSNFGLNLGYKLLEKKVIPNLMLTMTRTEREGFTADNRFNVRLRVLYKMNKSTNVNMSFNLNSNTYGSYKPDAYTQENRFRISLSKRL